MRRSSSDSSQEGPDSHRGSRHPSAAESNPARMLRAAGYAAGSAAQKMVTFAGKAGRLLSPSPARARHPGFVSSSIVTAYWLTHYPGAVAETAVTRGRPVLSERRMLGLSKERRRTLIRQLGTVCAVFQFGTAFAAARALRSSPDRQRLVAMDLRGMRLADSCFLTLGVNILQIYVGIRCGRPDIVCRYHHPGFDFWLCLGIVSSLIGSTLSYFSMEMNDLRARTDSFHVLQLTSFLIYRLLEIAARTTLLALFANVLGTWVFLVLGGHALGVLALLAWSPHSKAIPASKHAAQAQTSQRRQQQQVGEGQAQEIALRELYPELPPDVNPDRVHRRVQKTNAAVSSRQAPDHAAEDEPPAQSSPDRSFTRNVNPTFGTAEGRDVLPTGQAHGSRQGPLSPVQQGLRSHVFSSSAELLPPKGAHGLARQQGKECPRDKENQRSGSVGLRMRGHRAIPGQQGLAPRLEGTPSKDPPTSRGPSRLTTIPSMDPTRPAGQTGGAHCRGRSLSRAGSCNDAGLPFEPGLLPEEPEEGPRASPLRGPGQGGAKRKAETPTPWQKVMAVQWRPVRLLGCACQLPAPRFTDVWLLFACMIWPPSAFTSDATTRAGQFWWRERGAPRKSVADVALEGRLVPFPLYQLLVAGEAAAMLGLTFLHLKLHPWAVYYFKVVIVLHLLWGLAGHLWLATQHMAAQAYQEDDLDRAIRFKEMVVMQRANMLSPEKTLAGLTSINASPEQAQNRKPLSLDALTTIVVDRNSAVRHSSPAKSLVFSEVRE
ncbi:hypothetical protein WJX84_010315 [Apatococcus fuscideae]|uniref:Uncharacterized protein n=1 Tax=Apatococcus fuscideae TaxID=2026836 RepID=A0AAW1TC43_9CHLO